MRRGFDLTLLLIARVCKVKKYLHIIHELYIKCLHTKERGNFRTLMNYCKEFNPFADRKKSKS
jgi:hypothetical protein